MAVQIIFDDDLGGENRIVAGPFDAVWYDTDAIRGSRGGEVVEIAEVGVSPIDDMPEFTVDDGTGVTDVYRIWKVVAA